MRSTSIIQMRFVMSTGEKQQSGGDDPAIVIAQPEVGPNLRCQKQFFTLWTDFIVGSHRRTIK